MADTAPDGAQPVDSPYVILLHDDPRVAATLAASRPRGAPELRATTSVHRAFDAGRGAAALIGALSAERDLLLVRLVRRAFPTLPVWLVLREEVDPAWADEAERFGARVIRAGASWSWGVLGPDLDAEYVLVDDPLPEAVEAAAMQDQSWTHLPDEGPPDEVVMDAAVADESPSDPLPAAMDEEPSADESARVAGELPWVVTDEPVAVAEVAADAEGHEVEVEVTADLVLDDRADEAQSLVGVDPPADLPVPMEDEPPADEPAFEFADAEPADDFVLDDPAGLAAATDEDPSIDDGTADARVDGEPPGHFVPDDRADEAEPPWDAEEPPEDVAERAPDPPSGASERFAADEGELAATPVVAAASRRPRAAARAPPETTPGAGDDCGPGALDGAASGGPLAEGPAAAEPSRSEGRRPPTPAPRPADRATGPPAEVGAHPAVSGGGDVDLASIVAAVVERFRTVAALRGQHLKLDVRPPQRVPGPADRVRQLVGGLLVVALRTAAPRATVHVIAEHGEVRAGPRVVVLPHAASP